MRRAESVALIIAATIAATTAVLAVTPTGEWELRDASSYAQDHHFMVDVDTGSQYPNGVALTSVNWAQYFAFEHSTKPNRIDLARSGNTKFIFVQIKGGIAAKGAALPVDKICSDCAKMTGDYEWYVGHRYRLRIEISPRTPSDAEGNWWMFTLTDLDKQTKTLLGELKTPKAFGRLSKAAEGFLSYVSGGTCSTLRHSKVTMAAIKGDYGAEQLLDKLTNYTYGSEHPCAAENILPGMHLDDYSSVARINQDKVSLVFIGNTYRGVHQYGKFQKTAKAGMMFAMDPEYDSEYPYIYRAAHDGEYSLPFPPEDEDNADWIAVGRAYPLINDLYYRKKRIYQWEERHEKYVSEGDFFGHGARRSGQDIFFFSLKKKDNNIMPFPTDKTDNANWKYVGRHPYWNENLTPELEVELFASNREGRQGALYRSTLNCGEAYFILMKSPYGPFPDLSKGEQDNTWWLYVGSHP